MKRIFSVLAMLCPFLCMGQPITIKGKIINEQMEPIAGATISVKGSNRMTTSNSKGEFTLTEMKLFDTLIVSSVSYEPQQVPNNERGLITVILKKRIGLLDEAVVIAYGTTTRRLNTGSVAKLSADEIGRQPVSNPLAALSGRVPGLFITQSNGRPGSGYNIQIRGQASLKQGTQPLIIVDGLPFMLNSGNLSQMAPEVQNIFNTINPLDIESIEVLKDADATAIYGSQGANGVVLITTKKGTAGRPVLSVNAWTGMGKAGRTLSLMNTDQYLVMRRKAFAADSLTPTLSDAPDLLLWDATRYTNWRGRLIGGTALLSNIQASLSGGQGTTRYALSGNYYRESTVYPEPKPATRGTARLSLSQGAFNNRLQLSAGASYGIDSRRQPFADLTASIYLPPNAPDLYDSSGQLDWQADYDNPLAFLHETYKSATHSLLSHATVQYRAGSRLVLKTDLGYTFTQLLEERQTPIGAQRPSTSTTGTLRLATSGLRGWIAEPQAEYTLNLGAGRLTALAGGSWQQRVQERTSLTGTGYASDDLLGSIATAKQVAASNSYSQYRYTALFGRLHYNWQNRYLLNANIRRDGSSRFGPARRFATFGAIGGAWVFSEEGFIQKALPFLGYGKIRGSYGITGNDQVGDYQFFDTWTGSTAYTYNGSPGVLPNRLFNPFYEWERNRKLEGAIDLGFAKERLLVSVAGYRNRSNNQLVPYRLPAQAGLPSVLRNLDALIQNSGMEVELTGWIIRQKDLSWQATLTGSRQRNKLLRYPGLEASSDKLTYIVGEPLKLMQGYRYLGVDPQSGTYRFEDVDKDGNITTPADWVKLGFVGPGFFGGLSNTLRLKGWELSFFWQGVKQSGRNYLSYISLAPGMLHNQPTGVQDHWQKPGDAKSIQRFTTTVFSEAYTAFDNYRNSSASLGDASYLRLKNVSLGWSLPQGLLQKWKLQTMRVYLQGQNLLTITAYQGGDPETQNLYALPPLRIVTGGIQITL